MRPRVQGSLPIVNYMNREESESEVNERLVRPDERIDLDGGYGPLRLNERRRAFEAGRSGGRAMGIESLLQGISGLR